jgi:hypothetical protein
MAYKADVLRALIASPGDLARQRDLVERTVWAWNGGGQSERLRIVILPVRWETDAAPRQGPDGQAVVNAQLVNSADIVIALFHTRLGQPTARARSGTAEEIDKSRPNNLGTHVLISNAPVPRNHDPQQLADLREYESKLQEMGLLGRFNTDDELQHLVNRILDDDAHHHAQLAEAAESSRSVLSQVARDPKGAAIIRMRKALEDPDFTWRTVDRLAAIAGVSQDLALDLLRTSPDIELGQGSSGQTLARVRANEDPV